MNIQCSSTIKSLVTGATRVSKGSTLKREFKTNHLRNQIRNILSHSTFHVIHVRSLPLIRGLECFVMVHLMMMLVQFSRLIIIKMLVKGT